MLFHINAVVCTFNVRLTERHQHRDRISSRVHIYIYIFADKRVQLGGKNKFILYYKIHIFVYTIHNHNNIL